MSASILDVYVTAAPCRENAFQIFKGAWSSSIPGYGLGNALLFDDYRIHWILDRCNGIEGKRVLELGPLEGGHTYMLSRAGAASITSIEANTTAFLKCLIVQNALKFNADFVLGDFRPYLDTCVEIYDLVIASGVLYHMTDPVKLLRSMARVARCMGLWTHYYDTDVILGREDLRKKFESEPMIHQIGSREVVSYRQSYFEALQWEGFCGGSAPISYWLTRESLLGILTDLGFEVTIGEDVKTHANGPAMLLFAQR